MLLTRQEEYNELVRHAHILDAYTVHTAEVAQHSKFAKEHGAEDRLDSDAIKAERQLFADQGALFREKLIEHESKYGLGDPYEYAVNTGLMPDNTIQVLGQVFLYQLGMDLEEGTKVIRRPSVQPESPASPRCCMQCKKWFAIPVGDKWWPYRIYCSHYCASGNLRMKNCAYCDTDLFNTPIDSWAEGLI